MSHLDAFSGALLASLAVASASLAARLVVWLPPRRLLAALPWLQALAVGLLLGDALLHMLPEALEHGIGMRRAGASLAGGMLALLLLECVVRMDPDPAAAAFARMDLAGDFLHHLVDGIIVGASFAADSALGVVVALAVMGHELPREAGNASVLVAGGYAPGRAFALTVVTTAAVPLGVLAMFAVGRAPLFVGTSLALAAGSTIYLACSDVLPALWQNVGRANRFVPVLGTAAGLAFMWFAAGLEHGH
jgi:zinc and cadmium transporter